MVNQESQTASHVLTLPLRYQPWQWDYLDKLFRVCGQICNNLIAERKKALDEMLNSSEWVDNEAKIADATAQLKELRKTPGQKRSNELNAQIDKLVEYRKGLYDIKYKLKEKWGFTRYGFHERMKKFRYHYSSLVTAFVGQKLADQVWMKFHAFLNGKGKEIKFIPWTEFFSIEGKDNKNGIRFDSGYLIINNKRIAKAVLPKASKTATSPSAYYENEALQHRVKYCRIIRRWYPNGWHYMLQLILEGTAPLKVNPKTGELLHSIGNGKVGMDIGPQTLAAVGDKEVKLAVLADRAQDIQKELRRVNRAMDRSRRATNPKMFNDDGTIITKDKLPGDLYKNGKRQWVNSKRYNRLGSIRRYLLRTQAEARRQMHRELANQLLTYGNMFYIEDLNFRSWAKRAQKTEKNPKTGRFKRKKRFGKSIANKAPALFVAIMGRAVEKQGGTLGKINTQKAKASQYNHEDKAYHKKKLSQRWNHMQDGRKVQRDLYSAFLIQHTNDTLDGFDQMGLERDYENFVALHDAEIMRLRGTLLPSSTGIR